MKQSYCRLLIVSMLVLGAFAIGACGSSESDGSDNANSASETNGNEGGSEFGATVLDEDVANTPENLDAITLTVGDREVSFDKGERVRVAFSGYGKQIPYSVPEYAAARKAAEDLGFELTEYDPGADPQAQVSQIRSAIASGKFNALVAFPIGSSVQCDLLTKQAPSRGLLVATVGYPACGGYEEPGVLTAVSDTPTQETYDAWAEKIVSMQGDEPDQKAVVVTGPRGIDLYSGWAQDSVRKVFGEAGIEIAEIVEGDFTEAGTLPKIQAALQSHPDTDLLVLQFPEGAAAAVTALRIAGKSDEIPLYSYGGDEREAEAMEAGNLEMTMPYYPYTKVITAFQALYLARNGAADLVPSFIPYAGHAVESMRGSDDEYLFVTPENVEAFKADVVEY